VLILILEAADWGVRSVSGKRPVTATYLENNPALRPFPSIMVWDRTKRQPPLCIVTDTN
jgi:hypothetical protein